MSRTPTKRILIALTSHGDLAGLRKTGFYLPEVAHPWRVFTDAGYSVDLVSVAGGEPPVDGVDLSDPVQRAFTDDPDMSGKLRATPRFADIDPAAYDAVLFAGGHGTMWDFPNDPDLAAVAREIYETGGVVSAVCHGPAALVGITLSDGQPLVSGKQVAAFTDDEEQAVGLTEHVPFLLQSRLEELGAKHSAAPNFQSHVVTDGRLVTGQNPASATGVAEAVLEALRHRSATEHIAVIMTAESDAVDAVIGEMRERLPETRRRPGNLSMTLAIDPDDTRKLTWISRWRSRDDVDAYFAWRRETGDLARLLSLLDGAPRLTYLTTVETGEHDQAGHSVTPA